MQLSYDAETPLTDDQVQYAAQDAVVTLWLGDALVEPLEQEGLLETLTLECRARPFLSSMTTNGLAFDEQGWMEKLQEIDQRAESLRGEIAELTGGQATLFGPAIPDFNLDSSDGVRYALNKHCPELVKLYLQSRSKGGKLRRPETLQKYDSADKTTLGLMKVTGDAEGLDTQLVTLLLEYSGLSKIHSTYGAKMMKLLHDGRFHSEFTQCMIATGRTSSSKPNAQNFSPLMKEFFTPPPRVDELGKKHRRVIIQGDYSQAELRVNAQLTGEPVRSKAFASGEDQHAAIAGQMFNVDMPALLNSGEDGEARHAKFRSQAKTINFGLGYGMQAGLLADTLTLRGIPTSKEQAGKLIADFFAALPQEAAWLQSRDKYVHDLAEKVKFGLERGAPIDFDLTWRLARAKRTVASATRSLKAHGVAKPSTEEIANHVLTAGSGLSGSGTVDADEKDNLISTIEWASAYDAAVVLTSDGAPWEFFSKTIAGRRRIFQVTTESLLDELMISLSRPKNAAFQVKVDQWAAKNHVLLATNPHHVDLETGQAEQSYDRKPLSYTAVRKVFENRKELRDNFIFSMLSAASEQMVPLPDGQSQMRLDQVLARSAMSGCVSRLANAYRNAPIQGTVADAVLLAFAMLFDMLDEFPTAKPVTTVHDSIVLEVDATEAEAICERMKEQMETALAYYVPDVKVVADLEVLASLDSKTGTLTEEDLASAA